MVRTALHPLAGGEKIEIDTTPVRFDYTGVVQSYIVPKGVKKLAVDCVGAKGSGDRRGQEKAGRGGRVQCVLSVKPGQTLYLYVGEAGNQSKSKESFNGGAPGGDFNTSFSDSANGGGATDIRTIPASTGSWYDTMHSSWESDTSLLSRLVVAGAGGATMSRNKQMSGGDGGGLIGGNSSGPGGDSRQGKGGTQTSGGASAGGVYKKGEFGFGGPGNYTTHNGGVWWGMAGGGGWYGGGCGMDTYGAGGGGGSSYTDPELCSEVEHTQGYNASGNGWIILTPLEK